MASQPAVSTGHPAAVWTHSRRRQSRRKKLPFGVYWRTLKTLRAKCDPVERVPPHGAWLWRLRNDEAIGSSPFPWRKQETGAAGPTPNPASTNHLAPQYTVSDAKVGNRQTLCALVRRRGNGEGDCGWPLPHARCGERIKF
jgi:hypothetical protein